MARQSQDSSKDPINISHIPVDGVGGVGLLAAAAIAVYFVPALRAAGIPTLLGGVIVGMILLAVRNPRARPWAIVGATLAAAALVAVIFVIAHHTPGL